MTAAPMDVTHPGPIGPAVAVAETPVAPAPLAASSELDDLRAEVVRLRQANHRLIARFATAGRTATPPTAGEMAPETARASMARAAADLRREVERTVQVRDHLSREWAALHAAKVRLRATWEEIERRRDAVLAHEAAVAQRHDDLATAESELRAQRHDMGRRMAGLASILDQTVNDPSGVVVRASRAATAPVESHPPAATREAEPVRPATSFGAPDTTAASPRAVVLPALPASSSAGARANVESLGEFEGDVEEQARFDRFFSADIETEPSRSWLES